MTDTKRGALFSVLGACYGATLFACAFIAAGGGHGSYVPFAVFGAPLSLLHPQGGVFGVLVLWTVGGFLLGATRRIGLRAVFLSIHAVSIVAILLWGSRFESASEQWVYFEKARAFVGGYILAGWTVYGVGQIAAWLLIWRDGQQAGPNEAAA